MSLSLLNYKSFIPLYLPMGLNLGSENLITSILEYLHTRTHLYIYIYIYRERERERERKKESWFHGNPG